MLMKAKVRVTAVLLTLGALPGLAQETPKPVVQAYEALADTILALRQAESAFVRSVLDGHLHAARALREKGDWEGVAAQMALFANEGDNAIGGVRKRLLDGGHHFNAEEEEQGIYEPGYVIVTKKAKRKMLEALTALRQAEDEAGRVAAWSDFKELARELLSVE
jgi:hypothetical protein